MMPLFTRLKKKLGQGKAEESEPFSISSLPPFEPEKRRLKEEGDAPYSHGFEEIYSLETIDPKTIKVLGEKKQQEVKSRPEKTEEVKKLECLVDISEVLREEEKGYFASFVLLEPIYSLSMREQIEVLLKEKGMRTIGDLKQVDWEPFAKENNICQGYVEEIQQAVFAYIKASEEKRQGRLLIEAWLRSLISAKNRSKCFLLLKAYGLEELLPLSTKDRGHLMRLTQEKSEEWQEEAAALLRSEKVAARFNEQANRFVELMLIPWMRERQGVAKEHELFEWIQKIAYAPEYVRPLFSLFQALYCREGKSIFSKWLKEVEGALYSVDEACKSAYHKVEQEALKYCSPAEYRSLAEVAKKCSEGEAFATRVLRTSCRFRVKKGEGGTLEIRQLAYYL